LHQPSLQVLQATTAHESAAVMLHRTACQHKRPRCHPGCRNVPRVPNPPDEATPSHPQPTMGGTSMPTTTLTSTRAHNRAPPLHQPSLQVLQATTAHESAAVMLHRTACQHKRPHCRPGHRNVPRAPNPPDEATPSHPQPTMGGTSMPTTTLTLARAHDWAPRLHQPSLQILQATTAHESAAVTLHRTACQHKRPCCHPGCRNVPRAPNLPDEATLSHPQPTMGGTSPPTLSDLTSARANDRAHRSHLSPSIQPFTIEGATSTYSGGGFNDSFCNNGVILPPRECPRQKFRSRCVGRRHGHWAPNPLDHLHCGGRHWPRASNQSTG
jgi:hypothetical protein